ncbi:MAG: hypothetical protein V7726_01480 [Pseudoalteromonas distincta]|uniref:hypothetical protein n=1 Tax=Pseudoalteromonas distincta TaxID=77608 RepID=UPI00300346AA
MVTDPFAVDDIEMVFPVIEPYIERLYRCFGGYSVEEVKRLLTIRAATLHLVGDNAFFIAQWIDDKAHVLCAAAMNGHAGNWPEIMASVSAYLKKLGCKKFTFTSPRKGWSKVAEQVGFSVESVTYVKEL